MHFFSPAVPQGFTSLSSRIDAEQVCTFLHELFATFDRICESLGIYKWATVGGALSAEGLAFRHSSLFLTIYLA